MKYKGIELVEITEPGNIVFPKNMVVWDNMGIVSKEPCVRKVLALVKDNVGITKAIASQLNKDDPGIAIWSHCAEIPEESKTRATNRQLSKWLAQGNGECTQGKEFESKGPYCKAGLYYDAADSNKTCAAEIRVRKWDDTDWHEPTLEYMGLEG